MKNGKKAASTQIQRLIELMAELRSPHGCPWDREQNHKTLRFHAVEEVYELIDAIEDEDDTEMAEELGDLLLQVVFHCQLASERGAFDFERVARTIADKLVRRHPHVFGDSKVKSVDAVWAQWEKIKKAEKKGTKNERTSALDGIPKHLPALLKAEKLVKKARKANLWEEQSKLKLSRSELASQMLAFTAYAQSKGWSAEELLRSETEKISRKLRKTEASRDKQ
ncbi:MAG: MazG family protein [Verrucomicrobiales bacterium]|jgi:MazG family protein|nr:MazG family protein [Verrucomicrobiales bacterium]